MAWMEMEVTSERLDLLSILLLVLLSPIVLMSRRLKDKNSRFFSVLAMSRILIALILSTVFFLDWNQCHRSLDPLLLSLAFFYSAILLTITRSKGLTVCPAVWLFVCGCIVASLIRWTSLLHEEQVMKELLVTTLLLILLILCSIVDSDLIQEKDKRLRGRESASFPSRMTFHWVTGLVVTACRKQLTLSDLHPLPDTDTCQYIREHVVDRFDGSRSLSLFLLQSFKWEIVHQAVYRMIAAASQLTVCVLLRQLVLFLLDSQSERMDGLRISLMMGIVSLVSNFAQHTHMDMSARTGLRMRTTVSCLMFRKTRTVGPTPDSQTQLLLSVDAESLPPLAEHGHVLWAFFVDLMVCGYFLWQELRVPGIAGLVLLVMTLPVHILVSGRIKYWQAEQMRHKDQRIRRTEDFVKGIQVVKMHAWEPGFQQLLQKVRQKELSFVRKTGYFLTLPAVTSSVLPLIASLVSFSLFVLNGHALSPDRVFFCLSLFNYMRISLNIMPRFVGLAVAARVALSRIQSFLSSPDRQSYVSILDSPDVVVRMTDALLTWNSSRDFCLHIRELVVRTGTLVAITGPVASGKSSLLSAILQDMSLESGLIQVSSMVKSTAFVSQRPWIRSQSIRENILFGQEYEKKKLLRVLRDCQLDQEVERMAGGDMTHVGENGSNLSGGQKQRLTIARACYAHPDLLLMDDPFSAVDPEVGRRVFHNLFDPKTGCLRHTTCIIVSNDPLILKRADQVVLMSGGQIRASGGYEDLCRSFPELTNEWSEKRTAESPPVHGFKENNHQSEEDTAKQAQQKPSAEKNMRFWHRIKNHPMVRYSHYLPFAWLLPILFLISQALDVGSGYYITLWSQETGSRVQDGLILLSVLSLGSVVTLILGSILTAGATVAAARELHDSLMHRLMRQCMSFFRKTPVGQIMSRFGSDMQCLDNGMVTSLVNLLSFTSQAISISAIVLMAVPSYAPVLLILLLLLILVYVYAMTGERQTTRMQSSTRCRVYSLFSELLSGRTTVRTFPASDSLFRRSMDDALEQNLCSIVSHQSLMRWRALRMDLLANVTIAAAAVAAVVAKSSVSDQRHVLLIAVSALYAIKLPITLNLIIRGFSEIEGHAVAVDRVLDFATKDTEEQQVSHKSVPKNWATKRPEVVVSHLSVKYASSDHAVLQDVSLHIRGGEKVAIVGRTGGGKSTIVASLFRLMSPEDEMTGSIWIQGQEIRDVALTDLRSRLSVMTQDPLVFHESVRFNLDPMDQRTDQQVWQALHDVCLSCTVSRLERHLHHRLTDEDLSHGQRQLLSLARVLVRRPNGLLVLDEATSALDSETESRILRTIRLMEDATVILIAHRLQTVIQFADRVLVLKDGRIVESGPPHDLLADTQSAFYALFHD